MGELEAVCTGESRPRARGSRRTGIDKRPREGRVLVGRFGVSGDHIADTRHHGGIDQAVYAFAREDYGHWENELGRELPAGSFGENLTTVGIDVQNARIGERWQVGQTLVEVADVRIPCSVFAEFVGEPRWVKRFAQHGVPGAYLRVIEEGTVAAGDSIEVVERRDHDFTVGYTFRALTTEAQLLPAMAAETRISALIRRKIDAVTQGDAR